MSWRKYGAVRFGLVFAVAVAASNQTLSVEPASIALSAPSATLSTGPGTPHHVPFQRPVFQRGLRWFGPVGYSATPGGGVTQTLTASAQTLAISAPSATVSAGGVSLSAGANTVTISAPAATLSVAGTPHHVPFMRPVFQRGLRWFGPVGYSTTPETANPTLTVGTQTIAISAPVAVRVAGTVALSAGSQALALSAPAATLSAGGSALSAGAQTLAVSAPPATIGSSSSSIGVLFQRPVFQRGLRAWGPPSLSTTPPFDRTLTVDAAVLAISAPAATLTTPGVSAVSPILRFRFVRGRQVQRLVGYGQANGAIALSDATNQTLTASAQVVALSAPAATRSAGAVSLTVGSNTIALSAPVATLSAGAGGAQTLSASMQTLAISAPGITLIQEGVLLAGTQTIALSAPAATATVGAVTRSAGAQTLALSAPTATIGQSINVASNTIALSNGQATLTVGAATVQAGQQTLALSAPGASVLGATTLPDIVVSTLESRMPDRTLGARTQKRTLDRRNGDRTLEFNG
jgi:hypothetical protein